MERNAGHISVLCLASQWFLPVIMVVSLCHLNSLTSLLQCFLKTTTRVWARQPHFCSFSRDYFL
jgi:hypothetical protein